MAALWILQAMSRTKLLTSVAFCDKNNLYLL